MSVFETKHFLWAEYFVTCTSQHFESTDSVVLTLQLVLAGGIPPGIEDLWISCGSRKECQYTWDTLRNCNKEIPGKFKPRLRFDRAYIRHSHPKRAAPVHFGLVGIEKVTNTQCFPSDHWGLHIYFNIEKP